ncbi:hypothetical protein GCM10007874_38100 [Labrys miyagiensis]|uniref:Lipoprotein n=1 Tax=Labrys miyagiensis TaxID=346912 RepID=A0ABQ6CKD4_9HYPH|nr:hypothetical protein [Labrys miyagiensis]GLS20793.1 hypothetical protein GCM10007874_38100 [Labrys miyagiensis]
MRASSVFSVTTLAMALSACAAITAEKVDEKEARLSAAQFVRNQANTPAKLAKAQALPQNHMFIVTKGSKNYYVYADVAGCQCVYVGNEAAYQQYQALRIQQNVAREEVLAAELNQESNLQLGMVWGPGFYY